MWIFILRRLLSIPPLILAVAFITFVLLRSSPHDFYQKQQMDPASSNAHILAQKAVAGLVERARWSELAPDGTFEAEGSSWRYQEERILRDGESISLPTAADVLGRFRVEGTEYEFDDNGLLYSRVHPVKGFGIWLWKAVHLDFGDSFKLNRPVFGLIAERLWNTLTLSLAALFLAWGLSVPLGVLAAVKPNSLPDYACSLIAFLGLSVPSVFLALLMVLFALSTEWFPVGGMRDLQIADMSLWGSLVDRLHHLVLPTVVVGTAAMAQYMRQARGNMVEALSQDYVRTARAKGCPPRIVLFKHALRNAINPLVTLFGYSLAALLSGSFLVEVVMNWPGMARLVVDAIVNRDEPVVMAAILVSSLLLVCGNLVADLLLALVDPRVRLS